MSGQMRCLLDKVTARRILEGLLKLAEARELTDDEIFALDFFERAAHEGLRLFIGNYSGLLFKSTSPLCGKTYPNHIEALLCRTSCTRRKWTFNLHQTYHESRFTFRSSLTLALTG